MKQLLLFIFCLLSFILSAQHSIQSTIFDSKNDLPIELANVRLLRASDSTFVKGCQSNINGSFIIPNITPGNYLLKVSFMGYLEYRKIIKMDNRDLILKSIQLKENSHLLSGVEITGNAAQMSVKGDTLEFNATAFKTPQNAVVEDLLKLLPGVEVSPEGKITVNGEDIQKIRVNGKKFFGDDVEMATKNIPSELIDKIQVLDQKSDMAELTGFEDDDTEKIINLTFKPNRKKGTFGNITGGAGLDLNTDVKYDGNAFINMIDGDTQSTITGGGNNTNTTRSSRGRGSFSNNSGITSTQNIGYNTNTILNPKLKINGNVTSNHTSNETITKSNRQSFLLDSTYTNISNKTANNENYSANMNLEIDWKPDSLNTFIFEPDIHYNRSFSNTQNDYIHLNDTILTSFGNSSNIGNGTSLNGGLGVIFSHRFTSKPGRTFTANVQTSLSQNDNLSYNYSKNTTRSDSTTLIDQKTKSNSNAYSLSLRMSYVEPLWNRKNLLETVLSIKNSNNISEKYQYKKDLAGDYSQLDSVYSNNFEHKFYSETMELNYRYVDKVYNVMIGMKGVPSQSLSSRLYLDGSEIYIPHNVFNFSPNARMEFKFGKKKFVRLDYRGKTDQPSISQLQPVKNNSNLMNLMVGNPDLNPAFNHSLRLIFNTFNDSTFSSFSTMLYAQLTRDALITNSMYDVSGKQYSQTVNSPQMPYSVIGNVMYNIPLIQKRLHFNTNTSGGINQFYGYSARGLTAQILNSDIIPLGNLSQTFRYNVGEKISLTYTNDFIEIGFRGSFKYSNTLNNLNPVVSITKDWKGGGNLVFHLPYNFNVGSDINYSTMRGYATSQQNQLIWNASFDKSLFNNKAVIALNLFDILHQQLNIRQSVGDNYIQYNSYNTLTSYFLLNFTYKINQFKGAKSSAEKKKKFERLEMDDDKGGSNSRRKSGSGRFGK